MTLCKCVRVVLQMCTSGKVSTVKKQQTHDLNPFNTLTTQWEGPVHTTAVTVLKMKTECDQRDKKIRERKKENERK